MEAAILDRDSRLDSQPQGVTTEILVIWVRPIGRLLWYEIPAFSPVNRPNS